LGHKQHQNSVLSDCGHVSRPSIASLSDSLPRTESGTTFSSSNECASQDELGTQIPPASRQKPFSLGFSRKSETQTCKWVDTLNPVDASDVGLLEAPFITEGSGETCGDFLEDFGNSESAEFGVGSIDASNTMSW